VVQSTIFESMCIKRYFSRFCVYPSRTKETNKIPFQKKKENVPLSHYIFFGKETDYIVKRGWPTTNHIFYIFLLLLLVNTFFINIVVAA